MSKQQDELRERICDEFNRFSYSVLGDYDDMPRRVDAIEKIIDSEVQAVLDKIDEENRTYYQVTQFNRASLQRDKVSRTIEEVRKDYE